MMKYNWNMINSLNRPGIQEGYRFNYGKRSAEAEAFYRPYSGEGMMMNSWNRPNGMTNY